MTSMLAIPRLLGLTAALAFLGWATWWVWLSWDHGYTVRSDGVQVASPGPFATWQTVGCCASVAIATVLGYLWVRRVDAADGIAYRRIAIGLLAAAGPIGFAVPWGRVGARYDETGLYLGGVVITIVAGTAAQIGVLSYLEIRFKKEGGPPDRPLPPGHAA